MDPLSRSSKYISSRSSDRLYRLRFSNAKGELANTATSAITPHV